MPPPAGPHRRRSTRKKKPKTDKRHHRHEESDGDQHSSSHQYEGSSSGYESVTTEEKQPKTMINKHVKIEMNKAAMVEPDSVADYLSQPFDSSPEKGSHEVEDFKTPLAVDPVKPVDQSLIEVACQLNNNPNIQEKDDLEKDDFFHQEKENEVQKMDVLQDATNGKCQYCGRGGNEGVNESKMPESSERQPLLASTSRPSKKVSWKNCCGLLQLFSGSIRC